MTRNAWIAVGGVSALAVALALALVIALASAGHDDEQPEAPGAPQIFTPGGPPGEEFQDCLADQGVEPLGSGEHRQGPPPGFEEALEACREFLPNGGHGGPQIMPPG